MEVEITLNYYDFIDKINREDLGPIYLFFGEEEYLMNDALEKLRAKYIDNAFDSINFIKLDERSSNFDSLKNACETLPFMSRKKIVLIKDTNRFIENQNLADGDFFYKYLDSLGDHTLLILMDYDGKINKRSKFYKYFHKKDLLVNCDKLKGSNLSQWIGQFLKAKQKEISYANINYLIQESSYLSRNININLYALENLLLKLVDFSKDREIKKSDIDAILVKSIDTNIFELLNAINRFDIEAALWEFHEMYMANEPITKILHMIIRRIRMVLSFQLYLEKGYSPKEIQEKLQVKDYEFKIIRGQSKNFKKEELVNLMEKLLEIDIKMKTSSTNDKLLVEMFLVDLCNK